MRKCIIVDDDRWALVDIRCSFRFEQYGFEVVGEYTSAEDAMDGILTHAPELIITDVCMDLTSGLDLMQACRSNGISAQFIFVSGFDLFAYVQEALNNGALYYLLKPLNVEETNAALARAKKVLDERPVEAQPGAGPFQRVLAYVQMHYSEAFTLEEVAQRFGFNAAYLSEQFTRKTGMGFSNYRSKLRIERAMRLLEAGASIADAAANVGFPDTHYFTRVFKKTLGCTPSQWKENCRRKEK